MTEASRGMSGCFERSVPTAPRLVQPELFEVLEGREHLYSISGHDTSNSWQKYIGAEGGWTGDEPFLSQTLAEVRGGGWTKGPLDERGVQAADMSDGNPNGYYTITFDGNEPRPRFKAASLPADVQMRLTFEGDGPSQLFLPSVPSGSGGISPRRGSTRGIGRRATSRRPR
jgi:hypothetical protein